ncbi:MAG: RNA chaperone Hfq [Armatimonadota bacterium]|nr:MAG: RNA chaperone Hfq [Armatimonadota bacterium]
MPRSAVNLQDFFLNFLRRRELEVVVTLVTGAEVRGVVKGFDNFTVVIEAEGMPHLVYKHAIAAMRPVEPIPDICGQALRHRQEQQGGEGEPQG